MPVPAETNCIDIIRPFRDELEAAGLLEDVQFVGGIGSAALANEATVILPDEQALVAPEGLYLPRVRADGNVRDMDVLVLSSDEQRIKLIEDIAAVAIDGQLEVSIFGFRNTDHTDEQQRKPKGLKAKKTFVSDRYHDGNGNLDRTLFPFSVSIDPEAMATYWVEVGDFRIPTANPPATMLNYSTRSISGLRAKDAEKVQKMAGNIFGKVPDFADWIETGPGASQLELARILHSLQGPADFKRAQTISLGGAVDIRPMPIRSLFNHDAFMLQDHDRTVQENALALARVKSMTLRKAESYEEVVRLYQKWAERLFDGITKNR